MSELLQTRLFAERELIMKIVSNAVVIGMAGTISGNQKK